jgi:hypothetical protein
MTIGKMGDNLGLTRSQNVQSGVFASAQPAGSWSMGANTLTVPIHASLLPSGKIFYLTGDGENTNQQLPNPPYHAGLVDLNTNVQTPLIAPEDISCGGNSNLPSGNLLLGGGTLQWNSFTPNKQAWGRNQMYEFDFNSESFVQVPSMAHGRWYPTFTLLPNGTVQILAGDDEFGCQNRLVEIYDPSTQSLSISYNPASSLTYCVGSCAVGTVPGAGSPCYGGTNKGVAPSVHNYPRNHIMPSGILAVVGMYTTLRTWDPASGKWYTAGTTLDTQTRMYGTSILLPLQNNTIETGKILICGGAPTLATSQATNTAEIITPSLTTKTSLVSRSTNSMKYSRQFLNATILPTGQIFVNGGASNGNNLASAIYAAEMFDPVSDTWTVMPAATVPRCYHSSAILTQDGRVWTGGTTFYGPYRPELRTEIFSPSYVFATRPTILSSPIITGGYGGTITIPTPDATSITKVSLLRTGSVTHMFNAGQRLVWLQIQSTSVDSVTVAAPINSNIAPPGYYLIHILDVTGTPSIGQFIKIPS